MDIERNECSCKVCRLCCRIMPSFLVPEDIIPMMAETGFIETEDFGKEGEGKVELDIKDITPWAEEILLASDGSIVKFGDDLITGGGNAMRVPTLVPRSRKNNCCVFYQKSTGMCDIHENAPYGCRMFDCKISEEESQHKSTAAAVRLGYMWDTCMNKDSENLSMNESMYCAIWLHLNNNGFKRQKTTMQLRAKLEKEIEKMKRGKE